ncbi:MAG TPA: PEGA domain-containing protein, partial [Polyangiaceae bacterium]
YREYLRRSENPEDAAEVERTVKKLSRRLSTRGIQQVTVLSTPSGATVLLDGERFGVTPATSETRPGSHTLTVRLQGYADETRRFDLPVSEAIDVRVTLDARATPAPPAAAASTAPTPGPPSSERATAPAPAPPAKDYSRPASSGIPLRTVGIISLGAGGAALGGALVFELLRQSAENKAKSEQEQVGLAKEIDMIHARRDTARVLAGVGAGLVAIGGTLFLLSPSSSPSGKDQGTAVKLNVTATALRAVVSGRF